MVSDQQVRRLMMFINKDKSLAIAAVKAGMDEKTARKYRKQGKLPSQLRKEHTWRTRKDPFEEIWSEVCQYLEINPGLEAKTLFEFLQRNNPGTFQDGQLRTLQRRVKVWRATEGPPKEVFFPQEHHLYHLNAIRDDAALTKALGLDQLPEESNLRGQLAKASNREVERMRHVISENLAKANQTDKVVEIGLDIDSTVATVYGKQEGAEVGYNPNKRGRPSYSIKTAFIANNGDCVNLRLDGGKSHSKEGFKEFFQNALSLLPSNYKVVFVRLDKGYFGENTFEYLEKEDIRYVAASKNTQPLRKRAASLPDSEWEEIEKRSLYLTEREYSYGTWKDGRRMIIKKSLLPNPNYDEKEKDIFGNPVESPYTVEYSFYVTNISKIELDKLSCYRFYNNRATVETRIKEQKLGFNLDKLPVHNKEGNEVYVLLVALAYNILNWFKKFLLPEEFRSRCIKWIRMYLLNLPAIIQRKKKQYFIKFSKFYPYKELIGYIFRELARGKPYYVV